MLWVVLPGVVARPVCHIRVPVYVRVAIGIIYEVIVVIDIDVIVAAPSAVPAPTSAECGTHHHANSKRDGHASGIITRRWIRDRRVWIGRCTVNDGWIVAGNIDDFGACLLNHYHLLVFYDLCLHLLLFSRFKVALVLCLLAHALNRIHHIVLLRKECVAKIRRPLDVVI